ncbi:carbohydrate ABC transporter permease [Anaerocolumna sp. MB42-C2]|uniref:carbohydrate ABC transporter permease n=1 Tax=Anaerocolumna sp. MB42-C2 TaxID=3070997 RepID=UPI0027E046E0|nr:carbohydrate ABC transporter permease [Anaerocolumna sp. MB42-C2]WMJ85984.1 carbohydrate ABC transporter permease [Anaerocolumna sp. MB42-C2]
MKKLKLDRLKIFDIINYFLLALCAFICFVPFWYVIVSSVSGRGGFLIHDFNLDAYKYIFSTQTLLRSMFITIMVTVFGTIAKLLVTALMAYSLAENTLPGRKLILNLVIFTMLFSGGMIPTFFIVRQTGLINSPWSMVIPSLVSPFNLIVLKNFFQSIPYELRESARIDGCHEVKILFKIVMPLALPAMATFGLFYAVGIWNTYMSALLYIQKPDFWPIQVLLRKIVYVSSGLGDSEGMEASVAAMSQSIKMAVILVSTIPILCVYPFLQKHFAKGIMVGSIKG